MSNFKEASDRPKHTLHWFRNGLRLHDNPALTEGIRGSTTFRCIYILDPWFAGSSQVLVNKWKFLLESMEDLDRSLRKLGSRLFVVRGQPADILPKLFREWKITTLTFEEDPELFGKERDVAITSLANQHDVETITRISHTLYDMEKIIERNGGKHPLTYKRFQSVLSGMDLPVYADEPIDAELIGSSFTPICDNHNKKYAIPTLKELGFDVDLVELTSFKGGETEALVRLSRHLERKAWVANFEKPKIGPLSLFPSQTGLSPYLRFGCLSARHFYWNLRDLYKKIKNDDHPPMALHGQLLWREFFYMAGTISTKFDQMVGNPVCVQIPWDKNPEALAKWAEGKTGFPWIDAIMNQLKQEGWIHHLCRHAVACFLTRGDLWLSWEEGMKVFDELLLDAGWSVNAGSWLWLSGSSFFQKFVQCYCPVGFGKQADPTGDYVRRYLPALKSFPTKYIYEPWTAPASVQKAANCIIGKDYPCPMVNHAEVSQVNMQRMKQVYLHITVRAKIQMPRAFGEPLAKTMKLPLRESGIMNKPRALNYAAGEKDFKIQKKTSVHAS